MFENRSFGNPDIKKQVEILGEKLKTFKPMNASEVYDLNAEVFETLSAYQRKLSKEDSHIEMRGVLADYCKHLYSSANSDTHKKANEVQKMDSQLFHLINANYKAYDAVMENLHKQIPFGQLIAPEVFDNTVKEMENIAANNMAMPSAEIQQMYKEATAWIANKNLNK